jgi:hypothetical protein
VHGSHGPNIDNKRSQIIAVETTIERTYAITSENRKDELSVIMVFYSGRMLKVGVAGCLSRYSRYRSSAFRGVCVPG